MTKPTETSEGLVDVGATGPESADSTEQPKVCERCGSTTNSKMFRTGSVQHPGRWMDVCPKCGSHK